jgi:hypothetical protein
MPPEYANADTGRQSTFGQSLMNFINNRMPYQGYAAIDTISKLNPKFKDFQHTGSKRAEALARHSISSSTIFNNTDPAGVIGLDNNFTKFMYASIQHDKLARLRDYRVMAAFSEVADALDEICDECINKDENNKIVTLELNDLNLKDEEKQILEEEFQKYITYFDLNRKGFELFRSLLVDGEIYFEHIIHKEYTDEGILGVVTVPTEFIDPIYGNVQNMIVKGYLLRKPVFDPNNPNKIVRYEMIPMDVNQVTYINSGIWNENKTIRLPFIENARRAYRQLSLIEDAVVIYRLARAPSRLVFNVDVGAMPPPKAEAYLKRLMQQYWSSKTFDVDQNSTVKKFNPQSILDNFWFAKRTGSDGTSVQQLEGANAAWGMEEMLYFVKKLYKSLKVPATRLNPDDAYTPDMNILREELKFAKFIVRVQQHFAEGLKNGFITHLKLRKLWEKYEIKEQNLTLNFNVPTNFYEMREAQKLELKVKSFNDLTAGESISKTYAQKKYLNWNDIEIKANREFLRKDSELKWELEQIAANGPNWRDVYATGVQQSGAEGGMLTGMAGTGGGGVVPTGTPPAFGPPPGGQAGGIAPEAGSEPAAEAPEAPNVTPIATQ